MNNESAIMKKLLDDSIVKVKHMKQEIDNIQRGEEE